MDMTGEYQIPASRSKVWDALNDPEILKQCIPGCEEIEKLAATEMTAKVRAKVGPVSARFSGKVTLSELDPPNGYKISGEGSGGAAGFAKGGATVKLADADGGGTRLSYSVEAHVGGKLAQIGSRLIDETARKMANDFFASFAEVVGKGAQPAAPAAEPPPPQEQPGAAQPQATPPPPPPQAQPAPEIVASAAGAKPSQAAAAPARGGLSPAIWVPVLAVVVLILLYAFTRGGGH